MLARAFEIGALSLAGLALLGYGIRAVRKARAARAEPAPAPEPRDPTLGALILALLALGAAATAELAVHPPVGVTPAMWAGRVVVVLASGLTIWARRVMGTSYATTAHHPQPEEQVLIERGPYRWLRHPQYVGNWFSVAGLVLALDLRWTWLALLPFSAALAWRIRREESYLRERFGAEWGAT